ncbi:MAG: (d)CMP kinase [Clostridia bacterium]|nr:(d)CMP kinase [Clostridia bacterium]
MNEAERKVLFADLDRERAEHPRIQPENMLKFLFQGILGPGHLLASRAETVRRIRAEIGQDRPECREDAFISPVGRYLRLSLPAACAAGLDADMIAALMIGSERPSDSREEVIRACNLYADRLPGEPGEALRKQALRLRDPSFLPSHSEMYRTAYAPSYRLISRAFEPLLPVTAYLAGRVREGGIIAIDGPCASGKSTLADQLAAILGAKVVHTDDYVVPHSRKTPERLAIPGGNCDSERLIQEVLTPFAEGREGCVRPYDCHADALLPGNRLDPGGILILEGSYSLLPAVRQLTRASVFVSATLETRLMRLAVRESPESLERFKTRWIPLEEAYFAAYGLPDADCFVYETK